jgi:selenocysteine lyase/cysteine desulfurase
MRMAKARGATVREWAVDRETHELTMEGLEAVLGEKTKLVCFTHCSNVVGSIHDARAFVARIHEAGARAFVDGVAYAPHRRVDVRALGADAYGVSLYKVFGPHLGLLYVKDELLDELDNQNHFFLEGTGTYQLMPGNVSHELAASLPGIVDYLEALDRHHGGEGELSRAFDLVAAHEEELARPILGFLAEKETVRLVGRRDPDRAGRVPTITFAVEGRASAELPAALAKHGVAIRHGHFAAHRAMEPLGVDPADGLVRISAAHYNTIEEVGRLLEALDAELP